jgi:hypothetical protein
MQMLSRSKNPAWQKYVMDTLETIGLTNKRKQVFADYRKMQQGGTCLSQL